MEYLKLSNGIDIPKLGFGTYFISVDLTYDATLEALKCGYRLLDTAKWYVNEDEVNRAIHDSGVKREDLFITCKVESKGYELTKNDIIDSLNKFETDYFDLILIHWPVGDVLGTYQALEEAYELGYAKAIGISNFNQEECEYLITNCKVKPMVNQIETHIYFQEKKMHNYLKKNNICHESWAPFAEGYMNMLNDEVICKLAKKYNKSSAQVILRFLVQQDIVVIPKSINPLHIKENLEIFDFELENDDMKLIQNLDKKEQYSGWPDNMNVETKY